MQSFQANIGVAYNLSIYTFLDAHPGSEFIFWVIVGKLQTLSSLSNIGNNSHIHSVHEHLLRNQDGLEMGTN